MIRIKRGAILISLVVIMVFIVICNQKEGSPDKGISFVLKSVEPVGKMKELDSILQKEASVTDTAKVADFDLELNKDLSDMDIYSRLHTTNSELSINYFDSNKEGTIHKENSSDPSYQEYLTWGQLIDALDAIDITRIAGYTADSVEIQYPFEPFAIPEMHFTEEDKSQTYDYSNIDQVKPKEDSNGAMGYYIYNGESCVPVEKMSAMDGNYYCIKVSFWDRKDTSVTGSYTGKGWFGILVEKS